MSFQTSMPSSLDFQRRELRKEYLEEYFGEIRSALDTLIRPLITDKKRKSLGGEA